VWKLYEVACPPRLGGAYVGKHIDWTGMGRSMQPNRWRCAADLRPAWQSRAIPLGGRGSMPTKRLPGASDRFSGLWECHYRTTNSR
jgi:hypothetical protein